MPATTRLSGHQGRFPPSWRERSGDKLESQSESVAVGLDTYNKHAGSELWFHVHSGETSWRWGKRYQPVADRDRDLKSGPLEQ